ncbi:Chromatin modification-related protein [Trichinella pseudospiralis]
MCKYTEIVNSRKCFMKGNNMIVSKHHGIKMLITEWYRNNHSCHVLRKNINCAAALKAQQHWKAFSERTKW